MQYPLTVDLLCEVLLKDLDEIGEAGEVVQPTPKKKKK